MSSIARNACINRKSPNNFSLKETGTELVGLTEDEERFCYDIFTRKEVGSRLALRMLVERERAWNREGDSLCDLDVCGSLACLAKEGDRGSLLVDWWTVAAKNVTFLLNSCFIWSTLG